MLILLSGFIGALIGASISLFFNIWKIHRDERTARCDELCAAVSSTALLASEYWSVEFKEEADQRVKEARILGSQALIDGVYADLRTVFRESDCDGIDDMLSDLYVAVSGGEFSEIGRAKDVFRVAEAPQAASKLIVEVRRSHRRTIPFEGMIQTYHENKRRKLDMPLSHAS